MEAARLAVVLCYVFLRASCSWWELGEHLLELDTTPAPGTKGSDDSDSDWEVPLSCTDVAMTRKQRSICEKGEKSMILAIGQGMIAASHHCLKQFEKARWNCTAPPGQPGPFGSIALYGTAETAFLYAISSAGAAYSLTHACADGSMSLTCGCKARSELPPWPNRSIEWGSCSQDVAKGVQLARRFVDAAEEPDNDDYTEKQLVNLHNNKAGRLVVQNSLRTVCHCYGFKGCFAKVCYQEMAKFSYVAGVLKSKYETAIRAKANGRKRKLKSWDASAGPITSEDLVYNEQPLGLCEPDIAHGILGIHGRECSTNTSEENYCNTLCCQHSYSKYLIDEAYACHCRLVWWPKLHMECDTCYRRGIQKYKCN